LTFIRTEVILNEKNSQLGDWARMISGLKTGLKKLKEAGFKLTPQRRVIFEVLESSDKHMSAEEIHKRVKERYPRAGLATTYRTLDLLKELGLVTNINLGEEHKHYELAGKCHYHLVCLRCGDVIEFGSNFFGKIEKGLSKDHGFEVTDQNVEFHGYCSKCRQKGEKIDDLACGYEG